VRGSHPHGDDALRDPALAPPPTQARFSPIWPVLRAKRRTRASNDVPLLELWAKKSPRSMSQQW
jgi:hypothetical protein